MPVAWVEWVIDEPALRVPDPNEPEVERFFRSIRNRTTAYCA